jgi:hypothetical protein
MKNKTLLNWLGMAACGTVWNLILNPEIPAKPSQPIHRILPQTNHAQIKELLDEANDYLKAHPYEDAKNLAMIVRLKGHHLQNGQLLIVSPREDVYAKLNQAILQNYVMARNKFHGLPPVQNPSHFGNDDAKLISNEGIAYHILIGYNEVIDNHKSSSPIALYLPYSAKNKYNIAVALRTGLPDEFSVNDSVVFHQKMISMSGNKHLPVAHPHSNVVSNEQGAPQAQIIGEMK